MLPLTVGWRKSIVRKRYLVIASIIATPKLCDTFCNCGSAKLLLDLTPEIEFPSLAGLLERLDREIQTILGVSA